MIATFKTEDFVANLKAALLAACVDPTRTHMNCVRIELDKGIARFIATNGHWLWVNETNYSEIVGTDEKGKPLLGTSSAVIHVPVHGAKSILRNLDKGKKAPPNVDLDTAGNVRQLTTVTGVTFIDATFPPYAQVIPDAVKSSKAVVAYDPTYLSAIGEAFTLVASSGAICLEHSDDELSPVVITSERSSALAILMPRRHSGAPQGAALVSKYRAEKSTTKAA